MYICVYIYMYTHIRVCVCVRACMCVCDIECILNDFPTFCEHVGHAVSATHINGNDDHIFPVGYNTLW